MIDWTPDPIAISIGPITVFWYGVMYAIGLAATFVVIEREARRRGLDTGILVNGMIIVAIAALIGGRLYHVIDQWDRYKDNLPSIVLPPYSGLGVYGGIVTGFIAAYLYARWKRQPFLTWADCVGTRPPRHAGRGPLGELLQPGAVRAPDRPPVGDPDRVRQPDGDLGLPTAGRRRRSTPTSTRSSCTSRSPGWSGRSCCC